MSLRRIQFHHPLPPAAELQRWTDRVEVTLPGIYISENFGVVRSLSELNTGNALSVKSGFFRDLEFYDNAGNSWRPAKVEVHPRPTWWRVLLNLRCEVEIEWQLVGPLVPSQVAERICELIDQDPDDLYDQFVTHEELKALVRAAQDPAALVRVVATLGDPEE